MTYKDANVRPEYKYYFGAESSVLGYDVPKGLLDTEEQTNAVVVPWELKHVKTYKESCSGQCSTIGIPNKPSECVMIYDTGGAVRTFSITGERYDWEEEVSNFDFIHTQFNKCTRSFYMPFREKQEKTYVYSVGIEWLLSNLQSTLQGYTFRIEYPSEYKDVNDKRVYIDGTYSQYSVNVGITGFNYSFTSERPNVMTYTLNFAERKEYSGGTPYKPYVSKITRQILSKN